jgi:hypothetical protein
LHRLSEIDTQDASTLVCNHLICRNCHIVDRDYSRAQKGTMCSFCGKQNEGGRLFFPVNIHILVDLVHQAYHSDAPVGPISGPQVPSIGTVLFFCALREALLNWFIQSHLRAQQIPNNLIEKLQDDNKLAQQKFGGLFHSVVGKKWNEAIEEVSVNAKREFASVSELMKEASLIRNEFLHEGTAWSVSKDVATRCVDSMPELVSLFIALHQFYVRPLLYAP